MRTAVASSIRLGGVTMQEDPATWEIGAFPDSRIGIKITFFEGQQIVIFLNPEEWEELKRFGDMEMALAVVQAKHDVRQENSHE